VGDPVLDLNSVALGDAVDQHDEPVVSCVDEPLGKGLAALELARQFREAPVELARPWLGAGWRVSDAT
jgi:hypothetical protein